MKGVSIRVPTQARKKGTSPQYARVKRVYWGWPKTLRSGKTTS